MSKAHNLYTVEIDAIIISMPSFLFWLNKFGLWLWKRREKAMPNKTSLIMCYTFHTFYLLKCDSFELLPRSENVEKNRWEKNCVTVHVISWWDRFNCVCVCTYKYEKQKQKERRRRRRNTATMKRLANFPFTKMEKIKHTLLLCW